MPSSVPSPRPVAPPPPEAPAAVRDRGVRRGASVARDALAVALVALSYFVGTRIGFALTTGDMPIATFWPPNAILLASFLLAPTGLWWVFVLALLPAHFVEQLRQGVPFATALGWFAGNSGEALLGAILIGRFGGRRGLFDTLHGASPACASD